MSTVTYQCNTCKRQITLLENTQGLTTFGKCVITSGCLGKLYALSRNQDSNIGVFPKAVLGLIDYTPRKALYSFTQTYAASVWKINHNLSTSPAVSVYVNTTNGTVQSLDPEDFTLTINDPNNLTITFLQSYSGIAQCVARSTTVTTSIVPTTSTQVQVTVGGLLTIAIPQLIVGQPPLPNISMNNLRFTVDITVTEPGQAQQTSTEFFAASIASTSPWINWPSILIQKQRSYIVRSKTITDFLVFGENSLPSSSIPNGTQISFQNIAFPGFTNGPIQPGILLVLLASSPFEAVDKIRNQVIDVGKMIDAPITYFTYNNGDLFVDSSNIETSYPIIVQG